MWHKRLGHPALSVVNQILDSCNIARTQKIRLNFYNSCQLAKIHKLPFSLSPSIAVKPFELIHIDLQGPSPVCSIFGALYFLLFIDDRTRFTWFYLLKTKDKECPTFLKFQALIENQFNTEIKVVQSNQGGEFQSLFIMFSNLGIVHRLSCLYTSQQNGRVEQKNRHVVEMGLSLFAHSGMPLSYWPYAFQTATYLINCLLTLMLHHQSPYFALYHKLPTYTHLKVFGSSYFPYMRPYNTHKLLYRSLECVFLGYSSHHKGFWFLYTIFQAWRFIAPLLVFTSAKQSISLIFLPGLLCWMPSHVPLLCPPTQISLFMMVWLLKMVQIITILLVPFSIVP